MRVATQTSSFGTRGRINHNSEKFYNSKLYKELEKKVVSITFDNTFPT